MKFPIAACFALAAVLYVVARVVFAIPFVGFVPLAGSLAVGGGLAVPYLLNAGFLLLGAHALTDRRNIVWLLVPALWFGGYYAVLAYERHRVLGLERDTLAAASSPIPFDPAENDLGVLSGGVEASDISLYEQELVRRFRIPRVARLHADEVGVSPMQVSTAFGPGFCTERSVGDATSLVRVEHLGDDGTCIVSEWTHGRYAPHVPLKPLVVLSNEALPSPVVVGRPGGKAEAHLVTVARPDGGVVRLATGDYGLLSAVPMLQLFGFERDGVHRFPFADPEAAVASHLGLRPRRPGDVVGFTPAEDGAWYKETLLSDAEKALASLLDPQPGPVDGDDVRSLLHRPELVAGKGDRLVANLESGIGSRDWSRLPRPAWPRTWQFDDVQRVVAVLPEVEFRSLGGRLLKLVESNPGYDFKAGFVRRLADLGPGADAAILSLLTVKSETRLGALRAICARGVGMAYAGEAVAAAYLDPRGYNVHWDETKEAAYRALRRIGRSDLVPEMLRSAERIFYENRPDRRGMMHHLEDHPEYDLIGPESPPEVCLPS